MRSRLLPVGVACGFFSTLTSEGVRTPDRRRKDRRPRTLRRGRHTPAVPRDPLTLLGVHAPTREVSIERTVLEFASNLRLLCFCTAAPHRVDPLALCLPAASRGWRMVNVVRERLPNGPKGAKRRDLIPHRVDRTDLPAPECRQPRR